MFLVELAKVLSTAGQMAEAETALREAHQELEASAQRCFEAELFRVRATVMLRNQSQRNDEGETWLVRALAIARAQQARSWELRTATSLARWWGECGERQKATALLAPVYGCFTEGFETSDLKEPKVLLDALA